MYNVQCTLYMKLVFWLKYACRCTLYTAHTYQCHVRLEISEITSILHVRLEISEITSICHVRLEISEITSIFYVRLGISEIA